MSRTLIPRPLTREAFAPFGDIIDKPGYSGRIPINGGRARRLPPMAEAVATGEGAPRGVDYGGGELVEIGGRSLVSTLGGAADCVAVVVVLEDSREETFGARLFRIAARELASVERAREGLG